MSLWLLGYPDEALTNGTEAVSLARRLSHPFSEMRALISLGPLHRLRREFDLTRQVAEAAIRLCADHGIAPHFGAMATVLRGWALVHSHDEGEGIEQIRRGLEACRSSGPPTLLPEMLPLWADACLHTGRVGDGLAAVAEALGRGEGSSGQVWITELHYLKGELLLRGTLPDEGQTQSCFERALESARRFGTKSFELRAATGLARLRAEQGERRWAHDLLAPIYSWFTEGFETADLRDAKALLDELCK